MSQSSHAERLRRLSRLAEPARSTGRSVRDALERARLRHANRLASSRERHWAGQDLVRIEPEHIPGTRVLSEGRNEAETETIEEPRREQSRCA